MNHPIFKMTQNYLQRPKKYFSDLLWIYGAIIKELQNNTREALNLQAPNECQQEYIEDCTLVHQSQDQRKRADAISPSYGIYKQGEH